MCQAYEAERNFIVSGEHYNTIKGFAAARKGEPKASNSQGQFIKYDREAWDHGWDCWHERIFPYGLELKIKDLNKRINLQQISEQFKKSGKFPNELEQYL